MIDFTTITKYPAKIFASLVLVGVFIFACGSSGYSEQENQNASITNQQNTQIETLQTLGNNKKSVSNKSAENNQTKLVEIYDGRNERDEKEASDLETQIIIKEYARNESAIKNKIKIQCDKDTEEGIVGVAEGSFTKPNSSQKAFLYERCRSGRSFGIGGIIITEKGKVVSHYVYGENGLESGIFALPDINKNGLSEIVLIGGGTGQGYTMGAIDLFEFSAKEVNFLGRAETFSDNSGTGAKGKNIETIGYKISAQTSADPVFFRETYRQNERTEQWSLTKKSEKYSLDKSEPLRFKKIN